MFVKHYAVDRKHLDFQNVVDGLYYPFYMEWTRHDFMKEALGIDIEEEFKRGYIYTVLEYSLRFRRSLQKGDVMTVNCVMERNMKRNRVNFVQQIKVNDSVYAEATFVCTRLKDGRPSVPEVILKELERI